MTQRRHRLLVVLQSYSTYVSEDHVILGNAAVLRCHIPSFVADTVHVDHWLVDDHIISATSNWGITLLSLSLTPSTSHNGFLKRREKRPKTISHRTLPVVDIIDRYPNII